MSHLVLQHPEPDDRVTLTGDRVLQVITEIHNAGRYASREGVAEVLGIPIREIDEHVKNLLKDGHIRRLYAGCYEPVYALHPPRSVEVKRMATGLIKVVVGNTVLDLTPEEERMLAASITGAAAQFFDLTRGRDLADRFREMQKQHTDLQDQMRQHLKILKQAPMFDAPP